MRNILNRIFLASVLVLCFSATVSCKKEMAEDEEHVFTWSVIINKEYVVTTIKGDGLSI